MNIVKNTFHIYTRVSTTTQEEEGTSLDTQLEHGVKRAKKLGMSYKIWNEGSQSSSKDDLSNRPVLTELLQEIDDGIINHLYVWNTDRLSRNMNTWGMIRFKLVKNEVTLHTPTGKQILSDPQTNMMLGILSEISQYDNQLRSERFRLGKLQRIRHGSWMGGPPPFGYKLEKKKLVPNEDEQKWVKTIFEKFCDGLSMDEIKTLLLQNGILTRRGKTVWSHGSINKLLTNTHYEGFYNYTDKKSDETIRVSCPPLLSPTLVANAKNRREKRSYGKSGNKRTKTSTQKYTYLLNDLLMCGHCGARYGGNHRKTQTSYYSCNQKTNKFKTKFTDRYVVCGSSRNIRIDKTDEVVWNTVLSVISKSHLFKDTIKTELLEEKSFNQSGHDMKEIHKKIKKLAKEIEQTTDSIITVETDHIIGKRNKKERNHIIKNLEDHRLQLETRKEKLTKNLLKDQENNKWVEWVKEYGKRIDQLNNPKVTIEERKKFLEGIVDKVIVTNTDVKEHELIIEFRLPYVGDSIQWIDKDDKSKGYKIRKGRKTKKVRECLLKKS